MEKILRATAQKWQAEALNALKNYGRVAIRSGHGVGKSCMASWAILWFLFAFENAKVICTAPTIRQLYDVLWSELSKWLKRSPLLSDLFEWQKTKIAFKEASAEWFAVARTAAQPENLQGFHAENLLFVLDEASGISDDIFEVVSGALTGLNNKLILLGNPTKTAGFFKRAFFEERELFYTMKVSSLDSALVSNEYAQRLIKTYDMDSDVVRVRVLGEFPRGESDCLISLELIESAMNRDKNLRGELIFGVDVARQGSDSTVIATRLGDNLLSLKKWRHADLMTTCGRILNHITQMMTKYKARRADVRVDDDGIGAGVTDRLKELFREKNISAQIQPCHNGGKPRDPRYANFVTECYFALRDRLQSGQITLPQDDALAAELSTRKFKLTSSDKIILESKDDFKRRIKRSPDSADACALAFAPLTRITALPQFEVVKSYWS